MTPTGVGTIVTGGGGLPATIATGAKETAKMAVFTIAGNGISAISGGNLAVETIGTMATTGAIDFTNRVVSPNIEAGILNDPSKKK